LLSVTVIDVQQLHAKTLAYTSLVRSHLEYASAALDPFTAKDIKSLVMIQRWFARYVKKTIDRQD